MLSKLFNLILPYEHYCNLVVFLILIACGLGLPIPEDVTLTISGILVSYDITSLWNSFLVGMAGVLIGDSIVYLVGRFWGKKLLKTKIVSLILKRRNLARARISSRRYGSYMIFFARFMPGFRAPVYFTMGTFKKSFFKFIFVDGLAALISVPLWIYIGYYFGENIPLLEEHIKEIEYGIYISLGVLVIGVVTFHIISKKIGAKIEKVIRK